jgi:hypothetical protein
MPYACHNGARCETYLVFYRKEEGIMSDEQNQFETSGASKPVSEADVILRIYQDSVKAVLDLDKDPSRAKPITDRLEAFVKGLIPALPDGPKDDLCDNPDPITTPLCAQLAFSKAQASNVFVTSATSAASDLHVAVSTWDLAVQQYQFTTVTAMAALNGTVADAIQVYQAALKLRPDSPSRALVLWYQMEATVLGGITTYESSLAGAANALAAAAGTLLGAYATYVTAISSAEAVQLTSVSAAKQTFWQGVETGRDS